MNLTFPLRRAPSVMVEYMMAAEARRLQRVVRPRLFHDGAMFHFLAQQLDSSPPVREWAKRSERLEVFD